MLQFTGAKERYYMKTAIYNFLKKYKHIILILYLPVYMIWFLWLEGRDTVDYHSVHCIVDSWIPFNELFIIPYFLWFGYVAMVLVFLFLQTKHLGDFYRCAATLMLGMTTCLIIYTIWPNAQPLRPETFPRDNFLTQLVAGIYHSDTPTNVCPSIHVYNSIAIHIGLTESHYFKHKRGWKLASLVLCVLICLSTMFLKQHSFIDVVCALILYTIYYTLVYRPISTPRRGQRKSNQ